jgi:hypothetical protein
VTGEVSRLLGEDGDDVARISSSDAPKRSRASPRLSASDTLYFCCLIENVLLPSSLTSHTRLR